MARKGIMRGMSRPLRAMAVASVLLTSVACGDRAPTTPADTRSSSPAGDTVAVDEIAASDYDPQLFGENSATIDNRWFPLAPGTRLIWSGRAFEDGERVARRVIFTVTDLTKVIDGVRTRIGWDRDYNNGELGESELIFLAQDLEGNVWHLGQYAEIWQEGEFVGGRIWVVGDPAGAEAGILMKADPQLGGPSYSEGFAPAPWFWNDRARVHAVGVDTCSHIGCHHDVLVIDEFEPAKRGAHQLKYYAPGIGVVRVGWLGPNEEEREVLVLRKLLRLEGDALVQARNEALALEDRGNAYGRLPAAQVG